MGDTFIDSWQDELPEQLVCTIPGPNGEQVSAVFKFEDRNNSKWEGNFYTYERVDCPQDEAHRITIRSTDNRRKHLHGIVYLSKSGFTIEVRHRTGDFENYGTPQERWIPSVEFETLDGVIASIFEKYAELLPVFEKLTAGDGWEGRY